MCQSCHIKMSVLSYQNVSPYPCGLYPSLLAFTRLKLDLMFETLEILTRGNKYKGHIHHSWTGASTTRPFGQMSHRKLTTQVSHMDRSSEKGENREPTHDRNKKGSTLYFRTLAVIAKKNWIVPNFHFGLHKPAHPQKPHGPRELFGSIEPQKPHELMSWNNLVNDMDPMRCSSSEKLHHLLQWKHLRTLWPLMNRQISPQISPWQQISGSLESFVTSNGNKNIKMNYIIIVRCSELLWFIFYEYFKHLNTWIFLLIINLVLPIFHLINSLWRKLPIKYSHMSYANIVIISSNIPWHISWIVVGNNFWLTSIRNITCFDVMKPSFNSQEIKMWT